MDINIVRKGGIYRSGFALKINQIFISTEYAMGYISKTTIPYQTHSPSILLHHFKL